MFPCAQHLQLALSSTGGQRPFSRSKDHLRGTWAGVLGTVSVTQSTATCAPRQKPTARPGLNCLPPSKDEDQEAVSLDTRRTLPGNACIALTPKNFKRDQGTMDSPRSDRRLSSYRTHQNQPEPVHPTSASTRLSITPAPPPGKALPSLGSCAINDHSVELKKVPPPPTLKPTSIPESCSSKTWRR